MSASNWVYSAHMNAPCAAIASSGFSGSVVPSPSPSRPHVAQVPGRNWASPTALAGLTTSGFQPDSRCSSAVRCLWAGPCPDTSDDLARGNGALTQ